ncbi:ABC transporter ATP-binding protein [Coleofasciculus chthonoplastes]|uniref:ABC transporter ATP-binding protein n=1 Tax=Coleofasciculus chthonoplastes TaxID=64178 RepID=UPI003303EDD8
MADTVLDVRKLQVKFKTDEKEVLAVDEISFQVKRGQTLGIVGESGSGKSVTSLAVMGLVSTPGKITQGEIYFKPQADGAQRKDLLKLNEEQKRQFRGGQISMIFQEPMSSLNPVYTIGFQLIEAILQHQDISKGGARRQAIARLQEVRLIPSDEELKQEYEQENPDRAASTDRAISQYLNQRKQEMLKRYPHELSGGQLQRVMIAMAIACDPEILIADEPSTALDVTVQAAILDLLRELRKGREMSMIFITHDLGVIAEIADSVAVMHQGKIVEIGNVWQIFSHPQKPYTKGLLACRPTLEKQLKYLPTVADFMEEKEEKEGKVVEIREKSPTFEQENGAKVQRDNHAISDASPPPLLAVENLRVGFPVSNLFGKTKRYIMAVNDVSFEVDQGKTLGLVGESGCGKSTLARTLLRLIEPMGGKVTFENEDITQIKGKRLRQMRQKMQIIFQNPFSSLDPRMKIGDAVMEPLVIHKWKDSKARRDHAAYLFERVGLNTDRMNSYPHQFSGGQRQRVCIARALALKPKFIICDESVSALDVSVQAQVLNLLKELQSEFKLTYIFISHDLSVVKFMSDRIMVMNKGKIEEIDAAESIYREPKTEYTRQLIASIPTGSLDRIEQQQAGRGLIS